MLKQNMKESQQIIKGNILMKVKAKRFYNCYHSWMEVKNPLPFEDLPFIEQKKWIMVAHKIPASVEDV